MQAHIYTDTAGCQRARATVGKFTAHPTPDTSWGRVNTSLLTAHCFFHQRRATLLKLLEWHTTRRGCNCKHWHVHERGQRFPRRGDCLDSVTEMDRQQKKPKPPSLVLFLTALTKKSRLQHTPPHPKAVLTTSTIQRCVPNTIATIQRCVPFGTTYGIGLA